MRPADRLDPHKVISKGEDLRQQMSSAILHTPDTSAAVLLEAYASLSNFRFAGPWDAQRLDGSHTDVGLVDYANELIGMYAKAAGLPLEGYTGVLEAANLHNLGKVMRKKEKPTKNAASGYPYLSIQDAEDIRIDYRSVTDDGKIIYKSVEAQ